MPMVQLGMAVLLVYVACVNVLIVQQLMAKMPARALRLLDVRPLGKAGSAGANASTRLALRVPERRAPRGGLRRKCSEGRRWVVCVVASESGARSMRRGGRAMHAIGKLAETQSVGVYMLAGMDTFQTYHRSWCSGVPACKLVIARSLVPTDIFRAMLEAAPCVESIVFIEEDLMVDAFMLARLGETRADKVTCLSSSRRELWAAGRHGAGEASCVAFAYRVPWFFLHSQPATQLDLEQTAVRMGVSGRSVRVASLGA